MECNTLYSRMMRGSQPSTPALRAWLFLHTCGHWLHHNVLIEILEVIGKRSLLFLKDLGLQGEAIYLKEREILSSSLTSAYVCSFEEREAASVVGSELQNGIAPPFSRFHSICAALRIPSPPFTVLEGTHIYKLFLPIARVLMYQTRARPVAS